MAKIISKFLFLFLILFIPFQGKCEDDNDDNKSIPLTSGKPRPNDSGSGELNVSAYTENGYLYIDFVQSEGVANMTITNTMTGAATDYRFFTYIPFSCYLGTTPCTYSLRISTAQGGLYLGTFLIP